MGTRSIISPLKMTKNLPRDFEYGFAGAGPLELGLSALNAFVSACSDGADAMDLGNSAKIRLVSQFAWQFRHQFAREVLGVLPQENGIYIIKAAAVRQWIQERLSEEIKRVADDGEQGVTDDRDQGR